MTYQDTDVYRYLIFLQKYLLDDLSLLHELSNSAEQKERRVADNPDSGLLSNIIKLFKRNPRTSITTIATTKYPYSFEFMFGDPVISRSTIPHTSALFSTIDILGFLTRTESDFKNTTKNYEEFFRHPTTRIDPIEVKILTKVFRHGMTHNYFPKLNMEIAYHSSNPTGKIFFKNVRRDLVLNVNWIESLVTERLQNLINDSMLYGNMDNQFRIMTQEYERESRADIDELKARL